MELDLKGKIALVTGSSSGIGAAIAKGLASEGAEVIVNYHANRTGAEDTARSARALGVKATPLRFDVGKSDEVEEAFSQIKSDFGHLDVLVNNAGITPRIPFLEFSERAWDRTFDINIKSVFLCTRMAVPLMIDGGAVLNISSIHAIASTHNFSVYAATKGAMDAFTASLAIELAEHEIRVNAIRPGWIHVQRESVKSGTEHHRGFVDRVPMHRQGLVEDIVPTALLLCSDSASYITGQVWTIDGGHSTMMNAAYPKGHIPEGARSDEPS